MPPAATGARQGNVGTMTLTEGGLLMKLKTNLKAGIAHGADGAQIAQQSNPTAFTLGAV